MVMKLMISYKNVVIVTVFLFLWSTHSAHAYIDPGTGSYILQLMIGGFLGAAFALKVYWKNVKAYFSNIFSKRKKE